MCVPTVERVSVRVLTYVRITEPTRERNLMGVMIAASVLVKALPLTSTEKSIHEKSFRHSQRLSKPLRMSIYIKERASISVLFGKSSRSEIHLFMCPAGLVLSRIYATVCSLYFSWFKCQIPKAVILITKGIFQSLSLPTFEQTGNNFCLSVPMLFL